MTIDNETRRYILDRLVLVRALGYDSVADMGIGEAAKMRLSGRRTA